MKKIKPHLERQKVVPRLVFKFIRLLKSLVRQKWIKKMGLRRPKSFDRSFASHPKSEFWNYRANHWIEPRMLAIKCNKKFWFDCTGCEHTFRIRLADLSSAKKRWCPYCSSTNWRHCGERECSFCYKRSFASHPKSNHWSARNDDEPHQLALHSNSKRWFDCDNCKHTFSMSLYIISSGSWCCFCHGTKFNHCGSKDCTFCWKRSFASHPRSVLWSEQNKDKPIDVGVGSTSKRWFKCDICHHTSQKQPCLMTIRSQWCQFCSNKWKHCGVNDCTFCWKRSFASHPKSKFWSAKNSDRPIDVVLNLNQKRFFDCGKCGHTFEKSVNGVAQGGWCLFCSQNNWHHCGDRKCEYCFNRSFASHPHSKYWSATNSERPLMVSKASNQSFWFKCAEGHDFKAILGNVAFGRWCPECKLKSEKKCREFLRSVFGQNDVKSGRVDWCRNPKTGRHFPFDMIVDSKRTICEVDGEQHIKCVPFFNKTMSFEEIWARDRFKEGRAIANGFSVVRVRASDIYRDRNNWQQRLEDAIKTNDVEIPSVINLY